MNSADHASPSVYAVATMDTKGEELAYVAQQLRHASIAVRCVDVGTFAPPSVAPDVSREEVLDGAQLPLGGDRGVAVTAMGNALRGFLQRQTEAGLVQGVIGIGGSGGTALICAALRALPIGMPKLMVSTVASGNTAPYVDCSDITMMYSVVDVAGLNVVSRKVLGNAARALAGMVTAEPEASSSRPALGMTMFGVTTPCVTAVREQLESHSYDCLVFHATGTGGRAMEQLVASGLIRGVLDITTTEVADEVVGGVFPAGPQRFEKLLESRIPLVLSVGAVDMVNFGARESVPERFRDRKLHVHNAQVTLMRTTPEENREIAEWIARKLNRSTAPLTLLIPEKGVSSLDAPGQAFHDPEADAALFDALEQRIEQVPGRQIVRLPYHINDAEFAKELVQHFQILAESATRASGDS